MDREPLPRPDASSGVVPKEASSGSKDNAQDRVVADRAKDAEEGPPMGDPGKEVQNVDRREAQEAKVLAGEAHQAGKLLGLSVEVLAVEMQFSPSPPIPTCMCVSTCLSSLSCTYHHHSRPPFCAFLFMALCGALLP